MTKDKQNFGVVGSILDIIELHDLKVFFSHK